jgi:hypothetical protein
MPEITESGAPSSSWTYARSPFLKKRLLSTVFDEVEVCFFVADAIAL